MTITTKDLLSALLPCASIAGRRTTLPTLNMVRLESKDGRLSVRGTDLDQDIIESVACEGDLAPVCVPAKSFRDVIAASGENVTMTMNGTLKLKIDGNGSATLSGLDAKEFVPDLDDKCTAIGLNASDFADGIDAVKWAQSDDKMRYALQAVHVVTSAKSIVCEATDSRNFAMFTRASIAAQSDFTVPSPVVDMFVAVLRKPDAIIALGEKYLRVDYAGGRFMAKRMEGNFPNTASIVKAERTKLGRIQVEPILNAALLCQSLSSDKWNKLTLDVAPKLLTLSLPNGDNTYKQEFPGKFSKAVTITITISTLVKCLKAIKADDVDLLVNNDANAPVVLESGDLTVIFSQMRPAV